jgi:hypothetical protein
MIRQFLMWHSPTSSMPEQGRAIVWSGLHGETVEGCVSYTLKRRVFGPPQRMANWLPLRDSKFHVADEPIKYLPSQWRYIENDFSEQSKDMGTKRSSISTHTGADTARVS